MQGGWGLGPRIFPLQDFDVMIAFKWQLGDIHNGIDNILSLGNLGAVS